MRPSSAQYAWQELAPPPFGLHRLAALKQPMGVLAEHILDILSREPPHSPPFEGQDQLVDYEGDLVLPFRRGQPLGPVCADIGQDLLERACCHSEQPCTREPTKLATATQVRFKRQEA